MSKTTFTDKELKIAAGDVVAAFSTTLPSPDEYEQPFEYSSEFLSRMDVLVKRSRKRDAWTRAAQRAASIIIAFLIGSGVWLAVDVDARAAFITWIREVYEDSFVYRYFTDRPETGLANYEIGYLPSNFTKVAENIYSSTHIKEYSDGKQTIIFTYYQTFEGRSHIVANQGMFKCIHKEIYILGQVADIYLSQSELNANNLIWIDEKDNVAFEINANLDEDELRKIAGSIFLKNN